MTGPLGARPLVHYGWALLLVLAVAGAISLGFLIGAIARDVTFA